MIDLSPQPQDKSSDAPDLPSIPRHDPTVVPSDGKASSQGSRWQFPQERAETAVQFLSRWAGPAALAITLAAIGWWLVL